MKNLFSLLARSPNPTLQTRRNPLSPSHEMDGQRIPGGMRMGGEAQIIWMRMRILSGSCVTPTVGTLTFIRLIPSPQVETMVVDALRVMSAHRTWQACH